MEGAVGKNKQLPKNQDVFFVFEKLGILRFKMKLITYLQKTPAAVEHSP